MGSRANATNGNINFGINNYKGVAGSNWDQGTWDVRNDPNNGPSRLLEQTRWGVSASGLDRGNGMFFRGNNWWYSIRERDVKDGTSNTLMVGEAVPRWCTHTWWAWYNGVTGTAAIPLNAPPQCAPPAGLTKEQGLMNCWGNWQNNYSFMSRHAGGGHFALGDGSVQFISENFDLGLYRALATIQVGESASRP